MTVRVIFRSTKGSTEPDGRVVDHLNEIAIVNMPHEDDYLTVEGVVTHDAQNEPFEKARRFQLSGYVSQVIHRINHESDYMYEGAECQRVVHTATVWLSPNRRSA